MAVSRTSSPAPMMNDLGPLAWVLGEVASSLEASSKALKRFARDVGMARGKDLTNIDSSHLRLAKQQLRQVIGALEMVDMDKPAKLLHAMEGTVERFLLTPELCTEAAAQTLETAGFALIAYLEGILAGRKLSALSLFPQYTEVQSLADKPRFHPADLWEVKWAQREIAAPTGVPALNLSAELRAQMDSSLLQVMRHSNTDAAQILSEISAGLGLNPNNTPQQNTFWRLAAGLFDALAQPALIVDAYLKRALTGILLQAGAQLKDPQSAHVRLAHELLFFNAQSMSSRQDLPPLTQAVIDAYELDAASHAFDYKKRIFGHYDPAMLVQARKRIAAVKETWSLITAGESNKYHLVQEQLHAISESIGKLFPSGADLGAALNAVADRTVRLARPPETNTAMEVATSLLYVDAVLEDADLSNPELEARTQRLAERIANTQQGGSAPPLDPWMEELYRHVSDRQNMGSVVGELKISLGELEALMDKFFRNTEDLTPLQDVPQKLAQMRGVLSILGLDDAIKAVQWMREHVEPLAMGQVSVDEARQAGLFEKLGLNLGALGFLIDMLSYQPVLAKKLFIFDQRDKELRPLMGRAQKPSQPAVATPAAAPSTVAAPPITEAGPTLTPVAERAAELDPEWVAEFQASTQDLDFSQPDFDLTEMPEEWAQGEPETQPTEAAAAHPAPSSPAAATLEAAAPVAAAETAELDSELLDIFLEEAQEVVTQGHSAIATLRENSADMAELTTLRRSFHTLKGSSRMVGLNEFGQAAWAMEQVFNTWLADAKPATPALLNFGEDTLTHFKHWALNLGETGQNGPYHASAFAEASSAFTQTGTAPALAFDTLTLPDADDDSGSADAQPSIDAALSQGFALDLTQAPQAQSINTLSLPAHAVADIELSNEPEAELPALDSDSMQLLAESRFAEYPEDNDGTDSQPGAEDQDSEFPDLDAQAPVPEEPDPGPDSVFGPEAYDLIMAQEQEQHPTEEVGEQAQSETEATSEAAAEETAVEETQAPAVEEAAVVLEEAAEETAAPEESPADETIALQDDYKAIGDLRISTALFHVFLNEADDWSRRLVNELTDWSLGPADAPLPEDALALAHSLAGSSGTVGHTELSQLARLLEHCLARDLSDEQSERSRAMASCYVSSAEEIRHLLHQFAAGILTAPKAEIIARLNASLNDDRNDDGTPSARMGVEDLLLAANDNSPSRFEVFEDEDSAADAAGFAPLALAAEPSSAPAAAPSTTTAEGDDHIDENLFPIFEEEAQELLPELGTHLRQWQAQPEDAAARAGVLRVLHTLKGSARLAGAMQLGHMAHDMETQIEMLGADGLQSADIAPLLHRNDAINERFEALVADMNAAQELALAASASPAEASSTAESPAEAPAPTTPVAATAAPEAADAGAKADATDSAAAAPVSHLPPRTPYVVRTLEASSQPVRVRSHVLEQMLNLTGEVSMSRAKLENEMGLHLRTVLSDLDSNLARLREQLRDIEVQSESQMQSRLELSKTSAQTFDPLEFDRFTRVQELTRMMAESVNDVATVQRNIQGVMNATEGALAAQARQTRELQRHLLRTRMVEFDAISERLHRVVRQAAKDTGKDVQLDIAGAAMEIDRSVLERITPAFEHLLRNCVSHGIESAAERSAQGKTGAGRIHIQVRQEGNDVAIAIEDDGRGLNTAQILAKAREKGWVAANEEPSPQEIFRFIYEPSFSTASVVTAVSGRGVGMDVVRAEVQALGGRIETESTAGQGSRFTLVLPLTTAVTQVVMVRSGSINFGLPANLVEIVRRLNAQELAQAYADGYIMHRDERLPLQWSGALLQASPNSLEEPGRSTPIIIVRSAAQRIAVHVDEVLGNQEVVVKNLGPQLSGLPGLAGMSVLPSGAVALIYNPVALYSIYRERSAAYVAQAQAAQAAEAEKQAKLNELIPLVMVVDDSITVRRVTQRMLQREGYRVLLANDGLMALEKLAEDQELPSIILSDIEMPRMDGFDLLRNLRADERLKDTPVVMITSRIADKHREHAMSLGADYYLGKPYSEEELLGIIAQHTQVAEAQPLA